MLWPQNHLCEPWSGPHGRKSAGLSHSRAPLGFQRAPNGNHGSVRLPSCEPFPRASPSADNEANLRPNFMAHLGVCQMCVHQRSTEPFIQPAVKAEWRCWRSSPWALTWMARLVQRLTLRLESGLDLKVWISGLSRVTPPHGAELIDRMRAPDARQPIGRLSPPHSGELVRVHPEWPPSAGKMELS